LRPELISVAEEIITEIRRTIPEYARPLDGPYGQALRIGVEQAVTAFVDRVANPDKQHTRRDDVCRKLGQMEADEGRSLDTLQAAYRVGSRVAWQHLMKVGRRHNFSSAVMSLLADALFAYVDELASLSLDGYMEAKARSTEVLDGWRRRLLHLILERPQAPHDAIAELAAFAHWAVPTEVTMVAVPSGAECVTSLLDEDILRDLTSFQPHVLIPGRLNAKRRAAIESAFPVNHIAVGLTVPLSQAADALNWARRALDLTRSAVISDERVTLCDDHLSTLFLLSDSALVDQIAQRQFAALAKLTPRRRDRIMETLEVWLDTRGSAIEMADVLHVHPQTIRYRMRQMEKTFAERLDNPEARFAMELVVRVYRLRGKPVVDEDVDVAVPCQGS